MIRQVESERDRLQILRLLREEGLVVADLPERLESYWLAESDGGDEAPPAVVGCVGLESLPGRAVLLRSLVVAPEQRGLGVGRQLVNAALAYARQTDHTWVYLLTTSAGPFFARLGFERIGRDVAGPVLGGTPQWTGLCPSSAECYRLALGPTRSATL